MKTDKYSIVCFPGTLFDKEPYTNRQRVMSQLQARGHNVLYVEPLKNPITQLAKALIGFKKEQKAGKWFRRVFGVEKRLPHLWITSTAKIFPTKNKAMRKVAHYLNSYFLKRKLKKLNIHNPILWIYSPDAVDYAEWIDHSILIYDCVDEYAAQPWYRDNFAGIKENEKNLLAKADLVFTSAESLYESKKKSNENTYLLENVADFDHFNQVLSEHIESAEELRHLQGPIIGFIGAIDQYKLDIESVVNMAKLKPDWNIVLIGPHGEAEKAANIDDMTSLSNVHMLGPRKYDHLPSYIKGFDVCVIPYKQNEYTVGCFPLKFFEYMATGKPVVTVGLPSLQKYSEYNVYAKDFNDYISKIEYYLQTEENETAPMNRIKLASNNTWGTKVDKMEKLIQSFGESVSLQQSEEREIKVYNKTVEMSD